MRGLGFSLTEVGELLNLRERKVEACESVKQQLVTKLGNVRSKLAYLVWLDAVDGGARQILVNGAQVRLPTKDDVHGVFTLIDAPV